MILKDLKSALERKVPIRILTGNYLGITQPSALYLIKKELGKGVELRFYIEKERSFHPKAYMFHYENSSEIYIGSSNVSRSALTSGIEWNYRFTSKTDINRQPFLCLCSGQICRVFRCFMIPLRTCFSDIRL